MISNVSEGSVRDALSILDQAIIYSDGRLEAQSYYRDAWIIRSE